MKRVLAIVTCAAVLVVVGASSAMAGGPHHRGHHHGFRPPVHKHFGHQHWNAGFRGPAVPYCAPRPRVAAYPVPVYPAVPAYGGFGSTFGIGVAGRNFSMWYQQ